MAPHHRMVCSVHVHRLRNCADPLANPSRDRMGPEPAGKRGNVLRAVLRWLLVRGNHAHAARTSRPIRLLVRKSLRSRVHRIRVVNCATFTAQHGYGIIRDRLHHHAVHQHVRQMVEGTETTAQRRTDGNMRGDASASPLFYFLKAVFILDDTHPN